MAQGKNKMTVDTESNKGRCIEMHRLQALDDRHEEIREDIKEIRSGFESLTKEIHLLSVNLVSNAEILKGILMRFEDRDRQLQEIATANRDTFNRFGNKIDKQDDRLRTCEDSTQKVVIIERLLWGVIAGIGALVLFYIQQRIT
jgi:chromosome segregation ATPase